MKLRLRENSLRLRLLQSEVRQLGESGLVAETIRFGLEPGQQLVYSLEISNETKEIAARFADNRISVILPADCARDWIEGDRISLQAEQLLRAQTPDDDGAAFATLKILIEKDFVCLDRRDDPDNADAFPHPTNRCG